MAYMLNHTGQFRLSISKEDLSKLPAAHYSDGAIIIDSPEQVDKAVEELRNARLIGFDTETKPSFRKGTSHNASLIQLATKSKCFLFRINHLGLPDSLTHLLTDETIIKVGVSLNDDFHQLMKLGLSTTGGFIDLQKYVKQFYISDNSLSRIYAILFGQRISKGQRLTNWEAQTLTEAQINYAALDAIACLRIYEYLSGGHFDPFTSPYIADDNNY